MTNFLLSLSGVDRDLLARAPRERAKFVGIGGAVLMTAVLAFVSMTYALAVALDAPLPLAVLLGLLWACGILNLDRWIVVATRRQDTKRGNVAMILPRLALAIIIGAIISEPLVLRTFAGEIATEIQVMQAEQQAAFETQLATDPRYRDLAEKKQQIITIQRALAAGVPTDAVLRNPEVRALTADLRRSEKELADAEHAVACEGLGACGSGNAGAGPVFAQNIQRRDRLLQDGRTVTQRLADARVTALAEATATFKENEGAERQRLRAMQQDVASTERARARAVREHDSHLANADGLLARIEALHRLSQQHSAMKTARWALFLFILVLECMPVLVKLMMNLARPGPYDRLQQAEDEADHTRTRLRLDTQTDEATMEAKVAIDAAESRTRTELNAEIKAAQIVLTAQVELVRAATAEWQRQQLDRMAHDVSAFIDGESLIDSAPQAAAGVPAPPGAAAADLDDEPLSLVEQRAKGVRILPVQRDDSGPSAAVG